MHLRHGDYTGDVTALWCYCHFTEDATSYLFAGIGSQIFAYNVANGYLRSDHATIFEDGTRVHGLQGSSGPWGPLLAVHGGRAAKVLQFRPEQVPAFVTVGQLGPFSQWTLDIYFSQISSTHALCVVGLSNNSIKVFSITTKGAVVDVKDVHLTHSAECSEKLLLYSLSLHASVEGPHMDMWVAAGTVFLDVLVWSTRTFAEEQLNNAVPLHSDCAALYRLKGHDGSIHRVCWAADGRTLASASDDRTVRLWALPCEAPSEAAGPTPLVAARILYGHEARVWDVHFWRGLVISASEDCTCRIWKGDQCMAVLQGHRGRGVWRTAVLPHQQLATAGADGSIKIWSLAEHLPSSCLEGSSGADESSAERVQNRLEGDTRRGPEMETFTLQRSTAPLAGQADPEQQKVKGSKGDWVRSMALANHGVLYVGTNAGRLQRAHLPHGDVGEELWEHLWENGRAEALIFVAVTQQSATDLREDSVGRVLTSQTLVIAGEQSGWATLLTVSKNAEGPEVQSVSWHAHGGTPVLNGFWVPSLESDVVTTAALDGSLRMWAVSSLLRHAGASGRIVQGQQSGNVGLENALLGEVRSPFGVRILRVDIDTEQQLLVCGDRTGNVLAFHLDIVSLQRPGVHAQMPLIAVLKHAHQSLPVSLVRISMQGCVATASHEGSVQHYTFTAPSSPSSTDKCLRGSFSKAGHLVSGHSDGGVLSERESSAVQQEATASPTSSSNVVFSDHDAANGVGDHQQSEVDALLLVNVERVSALTVIDSEQELPGPNGRADRVLSGFQADDWILYSMTHRCELARVRCGGWRRQYACHVTSPTTFTFIYYRDRKIHVQRRCQPPCQPSESGSTGTSGVASLRMVHHGREIQCVALIPSPDGQAPMAVITGGEDGTIQRLLYSPSQSLHASMEVGEHAAGTAVKSVSLVPTGPGTYVMISGGAKEVLMAWQLTWRTRTDFSEPGAQPQSQSNGFSLEHRWLSTRPPPKGGLRPRSNAPGCNSRGSEHRYMAVAAFTDEASADVISIVAASSDASLRLLSFDLKSRRWEHVASLCYHTAPVLSLAHVRSPSGHFEVVFSGATDGAVAVWSWARDSEAAREQQPLLALPGLHQSGVNAMNAACLESSEGAGRVILATGGDDQALGITVFSVTWNCTSLTPAVAVVASQILPNAHSSALRGVWTDGKLVASVGLDQRLRTWTTHVTAADGNSAVTAPSCSSGVDPFLPDGGAASIRQAAHRQQSIDSAATASNRTPERCQIGVKECGSMVLQVLEPSALQVTKVCDPQSSWHIAVVGRGTQVVLCSAEDA